MQFKSILNPNLKISKRSINWPTFIKIEEFEDAFRVRHPDEIFLGRHGLFHVIWVVGLSRVEVLQEVEDGLHSVEVLAGIAGPTRPLERHFVAGVDGGVEMVTEGEFASCGVQSDAVDTIQFVVMSVVERKEALKMCITNIVTVSLLIYPEVLLSTY